jgi:rubrerythrin
MKIHSIVWTCEKCGYEKTMGITASNNFSRKCPNCFNKLIDKEVVERNTKGK